MNSFTLADCSTVEAALSQLKNGAVVKAGGVDLLDRMKNGTDSPARLVNIRNIKELRGIQATADGLTIGALTTLAEIAEDATIRSQYTVLADACGSAATPHIRNMATVGGNLLQELQCWYFRSADFQCLRKGKDTCFAFSGLNQYHAIMDYGGCPSVAPSSAAVAVLALDGSVELVSAKGKRTVALKDFYVRPDANPHKFNVMEEGELLTSSSHSQARSRVQSRPIRNTARRRATTGLSPMPPSCWRWMETRASARWWPWARHRPWCVARRKRKPRSPASPSRRRRRAPPEKPR